MISAMQLEASAADNEKPGNAFCAVGLRLVALSSLGSRHFGIGTAGFEPATP